ncbi:hypothetical protein [Staphylococcus saprophyticus]|nr:hypothetical protein [Staphylococcus saprophyticus]
MEGGGFKKKGDVVLSKGMKGRMGGGKRKGEEELKEMRVGE